MKTIYLASISMLTPLGADLNMVNLAIDAGISAYRFYDILGPQNAIQFAKVPDEALALRLPPKMPGLSPPQIRLLQLAVATLSDLRPQLPKQTFPLFLAGPEPYYPQIGFNGSLINHLEQLSRVSLDRNLSRYFAMGRAGGIEAILMAFRYFEATGAHYCLIGGVDTFYDPRTLSILDKKKRLAGRGPDGFVPGEGAVFALLASPSAPPPVLQQSLARIHLPGTARERGGEASTAEALAAAVKNSLHSSEGKVATVYSSQNGEMHYVRELTIATLRHQSRMSASYSICRPAEFLGDLGAAFAPLALGLASQIQGPDNNNLSLVCASSDGGARAAICLSSRQKN